MGGKAKSDEVVGERLAFCAYGLILTEQMGTIKGVLVGFTESSKQKKKVRKLDENFWFFDDCFINGADVDRLHPEQCNSNSQYGK